MQSSTVILYKDCAIVPNRNMRIDDIADYLKGLESTTISNFNYVKPELDISIKIVFATDDAYDNFRNKCNYVSIQNANEQVYYYFVNKTTPLADRTVRLDLSIDTINTFDWRNSFNDKTEVIREHKDRFFGYTNSQVNMLALTTTAETSTGNGATYAVSNGTITINGTQTSNTTWITISNSIDLTGISGYHTLKSFYSAARNVQFRIVPYLDSTKSSRLYTFNTTYYKQNVTYNFTSDMNSYVIQMYVPAGEYNNFTLKPMMVAGSVVPTTFYAYVSGRNPYMYRIIDDTPEGLTDVIKYKNTEDYVNNSTQKWYLMYQSDNTDVNNPVKCYAVPSGSVRVYSSAKSSSFTYSSIMQYLNNDTSKGLYIDCRNISSASIIHNGTTYDISNSIVIVAIYNSNQSLYRVFKSTDDLASYSTLIDYNSKSFTLAGANGFYVSTVNRTNSSPAEVAYPIKSASIITTGNFYPLGVYLTKISGIDRTLSTLIKIIECPYAPFTVQYASNVLIIPSGWELEGNRLRYKGIVDLTSEIENNYWDDAYLDSSYFVPFAERKDIFESKLLNSEVSTLKYTYDSFSKEIKREKIDDIDSKYSIDYYQSSNISSKLMFKFNYNSTEEEDYEKYLICNRNNEYPIYNSAYLEYIRTGYNYDVKNKNLANMANWTSTGIQILGAAAGFVAGAFTSGVGAVAGISLATSGINSITNNIASDISTQNSIEQKLAETKAQSISVSEADDLSLLNIYCNNKMKKFKYEPTALMKGKIYDLFFYCGYAVGTQKAPVLNSRKYFNYIQCKPVWSTVRFCNEEFLEDINTRLENGVTIIHKFTNEDGDDDWDIQQRMENFEQWIVY